MDTTSNQNFLDFNNTTTALVSTDGFGTPYIIDTVVKEGCVEVVFRREPTVTYTTYEVNGYNARPYPQIYKIRYYAQGDQLVASEKIYGRFLPSRGEGYEFD